MTRYRKVLLLIFLPMILTISLVGFACNNVEATSIPDYEYIVTTNGVMRIGITDYPPMNFLDGDTWVGFDTEFAKEVCNELGIRAQFVPIKWEEQTELLNRCEIDCIWNGFSKSDSRDKLYTCTDVYMKNSQCLIVNEGSAYTKANLDLDVGLTITCQVKTTSYDVLTTDERFRNVDIIVESDYASIFSNLTVTGTADAVMLDRNMALYFSTLQNMGNFRIIDIDYTDEEYTVAFRKNSDIVPLVNAVFAKLKTNGKLDQIAVKYGLTEDLIK